jgi:hypothetical protein
VGADRVMLFPEEVIKVRLVCREASAWGWREVCAHSIQNRDIRASGDCHFAYINESRAFRSTAHKGQTPIVASGRGVEGCIRSLVPC